MATVGEAVGGAGSDIAVIGDLGVAERGNNVRLDEDLGADGTMLAVSETVGGAGGSIAEVVDLLVAVSRLDLLCYEDLATEGAMRALSTSGGGTGGRDRLIHYLDVGAFIGIIIRGALRYASRKEKHTEYQDKGEYRNMLKSPFHGISLSRLCPSAFYRNSIPYF